MKSGFVFKISDFVSLTLAHPYQARGYETFFMLNSIEHKFPTAHKTLKCRKIKTFLTFKLSEIVFLMLINCCYFNIYGHDKIHVHLNLA